MNSPTATGSSSTTTPRPRAAPDGTGAENQRDHRAPPESSHEPDERGSLTIDKRVVEAMAARIAGEIGQVGGAARRVLGVPAGREAADQAPRVVADLRGRVCVLQVRLSVCYPAPVARITERVRQRLTDRLAELTDLHITTVDITVTALHSQRESPREIR